MATKGRSLSWSSSSQWDNLPRDMLEMIFKDLLIGDRVRVRAVCKPWNLALSEASKDCTTGGPVEAPWQIVPHKDFAMKKVTFKILSENRTYSIKIPDNLYQQQQPGWFCGSSRGWLLVASIPKLRPRLFLWNPINGSTRTNPVMVSGPARGAETTDAVYMAVEDSLCRRPDGKRYIAREHGVYSFQTKK